MKGLQKNKVVTTCGNKNNSLKKKKKKERQLKASFLLQAYPFESWEAGWRPPWWMLVLYLWWGELPARSSCYGEPLSPWGGLWGRLEVGGIMGHFLGGFYCLFSVLGLLYHLGGDVGYGRSFGWAFLTFIYLFGDWVNLGARGADGWRVIHILYSLKGRGGLGQGPRSTFGGRRICTPLRPKPWGLTRFLPHPRYSHPTRLAPWPSRPPPNFSSGLWFGFWQRRACPWLGRVSCIEPSPASPPHPKRPRRFSCPDQLQPT